MKEQLRSFLEFLRLNRNVSPHTSAAYDSDLSQFLTFVAAQRGKTLDELRPTEIDLITVRAFMADLYRQGQARASVSRKLSALRTFTRYMRREGWIEGDPVALAAAPRREQKIPAHLSVDEMSTLLSVPDASEPLGCPQVQLGAPPVGQVVVERVADEDVREAVLARRGLREDSGANGRRERLLASHDPIPPALWIVLIGGAMITIGFTYLFGLENINAHSVMVALLTVLIVSILFLIKAIDLPFTGDPHVTPEAFELVLEEFPAG